jgi:hypothetical protein
LARTETGREEGQSETTGGDPQGTLSVALKHLQPTSNGPTKRRVWVWFVLIPVLMLIVGEGLARVLVPAKAQESGLSHLISNDGGHLSLAPNSTFRARDGEVRINKHGLRGDLPDPARIKIAVLGGDSVFNGHIASSQKTLCGVLETGLTLNRSSNRFQFINAGLPKMTCRDFDDVVSRVLIPEKVDVVVLMVGAAELEMIMRGGKPPAARPTADLQESSVDRGFVWSALWEYLTAAAGSESVLQTASEAPMDGDDAIRQGMKQFGQSMRALVKKCRAAKMGVVLATEPCISMSEGTDLVIARNEAARSMGFDLVSMARVAENVRAILSALAGMDKSVHFSDLARRISGDERLGGETGGMFGSKEKSLYAVPDPVLGQGLTEAGISRVARLIEEVLIETRAWGAQRNTIGADPVAE